MLGVIRRYANATNQGDIVLSPKNTMYNCPNQRDARDHIGPYRPLVGALNFPRAALTGGPHVRSLPRPRSAAAEARPDTWSLPPG